MSDPIEIKMPLNKAIRGITMPARMLSLPINDRGFPVPWFVAWMKHGEEVRPGEGEPDFRVIATGKVRDAVLGKKCWLCGQQLGKWQSFTIGPMCAVNRISAEPPSHHDCSTYACKACPFLANPRTRRNDKDLPEHEKAPGIGIPRNPGVILQWTTNRFTITPERLFSIGPPQSLEWWCEGRKATREEVEASFESGLPLLRETCDQELTPQRQADAHLALERCVREARKLLPAEA